MLPWQWILMAAVAAALVILGVLVLAAVAARRTPKGKNPEGKIIIGG